ncbi:MAG TPA: alpha/beta fold hydrolase [Solirubrobacteraceae bacterium]|nr:alpha/beta fold hydrolase [Solirubrobacteraceae bacterium]
MESRPPRRALVLVHGLATTRWIWDLVAPLLAQRRRVVTLDVAGFGESEPVGAGFELDRVAERISRGLAAHGVRGPLDLVGHSSAPGSRRRWPCVARPACGGWCSWRTSEALATIGEGRLAALLAQTAQPLGVIWGREDRTVPPRHVTAVRRVRPDAEIELLDHAGHVPMVERPEQFVVALERLLSVLAA